MSEYKIKKLDNNLQIAAYPMPGMDSVSIGIWAGIGGRYETSAQQGISHFIEHLLFKGSKKRSAVEISRAIEGVGGSINAYTSEEYTCFFIKVRGRHQGLALDVLWDMVLNPLFEPKNVEKERLVIKEEIHMILDYPSHYVRELVQKLMWEGHPLGRMLVGTEESLNVIKISDIIDFQRRNYFPSNMLLVSAGNIDINSLIEDSKVYTGSISNYTKPECEIFTEEGKSPRIKILSKPTEQIHICVGMHSVKREDTDRYVVKLMSIILGGNMSSRLFQIIREKYGFAYDVNSSIDFFKDTGAFVISGGVKRNKLKKFIELVLQELAKIKKNGVTEAELSQAKEFYEGQLALGFENTMSRMLWMGEYLITTDKMPSRQEIINNVESVTIDDIRRTAKKIFTRDNLNVAIIGPVDEGTKLELNL